MATISQTELGREYIDDHPDMVYTMKNFYRKDQGGWKCVDETLIRQEVWELLEKYEQQNLCTPSSRLAGSVLRYIREKLFMSDSDARQNLGIQPHVGVTTDQISHAQAGDIYIQARIIKQSAHNICNTLYGRGQWYRWDSTVWQQLDESVVWNEIWDILKEREKRGEARAIFSNAKGTYEYLSSRLHVSDDVLDARPNLINMQNGVYDLDLDAILTPHPEFYLTSKLPFVYDPSATCPTWEYYLTTTFTQKAPDNKDPDPELVQFLQEAIGYSLTTDIGHHISFWCVGEGSNGKGVLFHVLGSLVGDAAPLNLDMLSRDRYQLANLAGKRIALCTEANSFDNVVEDADFKALIAGDPMRVRQIYEKPFILYPTVKLWWSMNRLPAVADTSHGFWRRVKIIPFNRLFDTDEKILNLTEMLQPELPGIFNWAIQGLRRLKQSGTFTIPTQVAEFTKEYQEESNVVLSFIRDECIVGKDLEEQASLLYDSYQQWCKRNGFGAFNIKNFKRELVALGHHRVHRISGSHYLGLELRVKP